MFFTIDRAKERLLSAGQYLQKAVIHDDLNSPELFRLIHDAQNQLALALATIVQMEADATIPSDEPKKYEAWNERPGALVEALTYESNRLAHPNRTRLPHVSVKLYTVAERNIIADAIAVIERTNPAHLETELDDSCG